MHEYGFWLRHMTRAVTSASASGADGCVPGARLPGGHSSMSKVSESQNPYLKTDLSTFETFLTTLGTRNLPRVRAPQQCNRG